MSDHIIDHDTEQATRKILTYWFGASIVNSWKITDRTVIATAELLEATKECGSIFKYVPKPSGAMGGIGIVGSMAFNYAKDAIKRAATDNSYYRSCVKTQAIHRRSVVEETTDF